MERRTSTVQVTLNLHPSDSVAPIEATNVVTILHEDKAVCQQKNVLALVDSDFDENFITALNGVFNLVGLKLEKINGNDS